MKLQLHDNPHVPFYKRISYLYIPAVFVITSVLMELLMFALMGLAFPRAYIFSLSIVLVIATVVALLPQKWLQTTVCSIFVGGQVFVTISNIISFNKCNEIFSLETFKTLGTAFGAAGAVSLNLFFLIFIIGLLILYITAIVLIMWFCQLPKGYRTYQFRVLSCGILAFVSLFSYNFAYVSLPNYQQSGYVNNLSNQKFVYDTFSNRIANFQTFGTYSYYLDNLVSLFGGKSEAIEIMSLEMSEDFQANKFALHAEEVLGEGYNLITVLMETFERQAINPITMPNLYEFMQQSCTEVNGYYSIERTCFTDYLNQTGMHVLGKEFWNNYSHVQAPNTLAKIFGRSENVDYKIEAFHSTDGTCYNRNNLFVNTMGFEKFNNYYTYAEKDERFAQEYAMNSDELLFTRNLEEIAPADQNFYSYVLSASTHSINNKKYDMRDYYEAEYEYIEKAANWEALVALYPVLASTDTLKVRTAKAYLAGTYSFDKGFGALIDYLKATDDEVHPGKKLIETTALVMFGDHYYYANPSTLKVEKNALSLAGNRCSLIVYNPRAKAEHETLGIITQAENALLSTPDDCGETLNRFTSTMDIYPTICSLFGIQTDQQLTYGRSIFDDSPSIGVAYLSGYVWGVNPDKGYIENTDAVDNVNGGPQIDWQLWRTYDFANYNGITLNQTQLDKIAPTINRVFGSIFLNSKLYAQDGFEDLDKAYYRLGSSTII